MRSGTHVTLGIAGLVPLAGVALAAVPDAGDAGVPVRPAPSIVRVDVLAAADVGRAALTLGDVALVSSSDCDASSALAALPLGTLHRDSTVIERSALERWVRLRRVATASRIEWTGASRVVVSRRRPQIPAGDVASEAVRAMQHVLTRAGLRAQVDVEEPPRAVGAPDDGYELTAREPSAGAFLSPRPWLYVDVRSRGRFVRTVPVGLRVTAFGTGSVCRRPLASGAILAPEDLVEQEVQWSGLPAEPLAVTAAAGLRLRRPCAAGNVLTRDAVEAAPDVGAGGGLVLRVRSGGVLVETPAKALQDGRIGQVIGVERTSGSARLRARVTGNGEAEVVP